MEVKGGDLIAEMKNPEAGWASGFFVGWLGPNLAATETQLAIKHGHNRDVLVRPKTAGGDDESGKNQIISPSFSIFNVEKCHNIGEKL